MECIKETSGESLKILLSAGDSLYGEVISKLSNTTKIKKYTSRDLSFDELDEWRTYTLPDILCSRYPGGVQLEKQELVDLMEWKLTKGKFRPMLRKLIDSNDPKTVASVTNRGFENMINYYSELSNKDTFNYDSFQKALKESLLIFSELKGVGPATASLLASLLSFILKVKDFDRKVIIIPPFFCDEACDALNPKLTVKLKYNLKEYFDLNLEKYITILGGASRISKSYDLNESERALWAIKRGQLENVQVDKKYLDALTNLLLSKPSLGSIKRGADDIDDSSAAKPKRRRKYIAS
ncbi:hypothetical protein CANARDRAFT_26068 [[Candida] arabinofermentans NRRL YB-2248]|uniref:Uncharacterized protein n=1 Tax=[Candida] arabinofermentans NRRL YB-2248 TaxID=983967 RepID=A0A1E4T7Z4_9ASCO|nr:hypothetical protein CANARDRAFT_26068 [[Candida] arabinofermentans NRRL YB-2248]